MHNSKHFSPHVQHGMAHQGKRTSRAATEGTKVELAVEHHQHYRGRAEELVDGYTEKLRWWLRLAWWRALEVPNEQFEGDGGRDGLEHIGAEELRSR